MSFPRYPAYKDSRVVWLGDIPSHWKVKPMKWVITRNDGGVWGNDPKGEDDTVVLRSTEQTVDGRWQLDEPALRSLSETEKAGSLLATGDLLVTKSSGSALHIGKTTLVTPEVAALGCCYSNFMQRIRLKPEFDSRLAWYLMNNEIARTQFDLLSNSTTGLANLNGTMLGELVAPIPSPDEQAEIVRFLDRETAKIDALVTEQVQLTTLLKEKRQAVISHAVTKGLDPSVPMKDSGVEWLGEVPEHWDVNAIKHIVATPITDGPHETPAFPDEGIPFVSAEAVSTGVIDFQRIRGFISEEDHARYSLKYKPQRGDIFMVKSGATTGVTAMVETDLDFNIWSPLAVIRPSLFMSPRYVLQFMRSGNFQEAVTLNWSFGTQQNIGMGVIENLMIAVPPLAEQVAIADHLGLMLDQFQPLITEATQAIQLLQERRSALISAAVTGQIDVRGLATQEAA